MQNHNWIYLVTIAAIGGILFIRFHSYAQIKTVERFQREALAFVEANPECEICEQCSIKWENR